MSNGTQAQNKNEKPLKPYGQNAKIGKVKSVPGQPTNSKSNRDGDAKNKLSYKYNAPALKTGSANLKTYGTNTPKKTSGGIFGRFFGK